MARVLQPFRTMGIRLSYYLDDVCLMASSREQALRHSQILRRHLLNIGFLLGTKKCCWEPLEMQQSLELIIDTKKMELRLPKEEINRIKKDM
jgi:hypothetical protein